MKDRGLWALDTLSCVFMAWELWTISDQDWTSLPSVSLAGRDDDQKSLEERSDGATECLERCRFVPPGDEEEIHGDRRGDDRQADRWNWINFYHPELWWAARTCLYGCDYHGDHSNEDGGQDVDDGEDEVHLKFDLFCRKSLLFSEQRDKWYLDRAFPVGLLPSQPGNAEDSQTDRNLQTFIVWKTLLVLSCKHSVKCKHYFVELFYMPYVVKCFFIFLIRNQSNNLSQHCSNFKQYALSDCDQDKKGVSMFSMILTQVANPV